MNDSKPSMCPESTVDSANRRNFVRKAAGVAAAAIAGGALLQSGKLIPESSATDCSALLVGTTNGACLPTALCANAPVDFAFRIFNNGTCGSGLTVGASETGLIASAAVIGVLAEGNGLCSIPIAAVGEGSILQKWESRPFGGKEVVVVGVVDSKGSLGAGTAAPSAKLHAVSSGPSCIPIIAQGASCQSANLQEWQVCSTIKSVVNKCGWIGIGTSSPANPLCVVGSIGATLAAVHGSGCSVPGVRGCSSTSYGVQGYSPKGVGSVGQSCCSWGIWGLSKNSAGVYGSSCAVGLQGVAHSPGAVPIVAQAASGQTGNLMQFEKSCGGSLSVVNKDGWLGVGTSKPQTTLQVNGGMSLGIKREALAKCYTMKTSCFAILADASTTGKRITLPPAKNAGMVVFIKNISPNAVTVKVAGTDSIEVGGTLSPTYSLSKQYSSVTLISGGGSPGTWYILSSAL